MRFSIRTFASFCGCLGAGALLWGTLGLAETAHAQEPAGPKHTLKDIMKIGHKDGLLKKILEGQGTPEDKQLLLDLYISMFEAKPEKGELDSWRELAGAAALAAGKVVVGRPDGLEMLKATSNCKACHDLHK